MGVYFLPKTGYENKPELAAEWFLEAAKQGHPEAQYELFNCYNQGIGVTKDKDQAIHWLRKAAGQNHTLAQAWLGYYLQTGKYVVKNVKEALRLYHLTIAKGCAFAEEKLAFCYAHGLEDEIKQDDKQAVEWFRKAAEKGRQNAQFALGQCYQHGIGVRRDLRAAKQWYQAAATQGHLKATKAAEKLAAAKTTPYSSNSFGIHRASTSVSTASTIKSFNRSAVPANGKT